MQHLQSNTTLQGGKYKIENVLGQGGFGITYLAEQTLLKKKVAIKEFFIRELCARDDTTCVHTITQADMVERYRQKFFKEAQILANLEHPGIVRVTDIFEENNTAYYVMDYVKGESLDNIIKRNGPLSESTALHYITKVADALNYIHLMNANHLDIKPANIMIRQDDDTPILIDFGVSKQYDENKDQTTTTPPGVSNGYSPIEQYRPGGVSTFSPQADIYALGATLYKLLTGKTPPNASDILNNGLPPLPLSLSPQIRAAIEKAMQPRCIDRPENVNALLEMLDAGYKEETQVIPSKGKKGKAIVLNGEIVEVETPNSGNKKKPSYYLWVIPIVALLTVGLIMYLQEANNLSQLSSQKAVMDDGASKTPSVRDEDTPPLEEKEELASNIAFEHSSELENNSISVNASESMADKGFIKNVEQNNQIKLKGSFYNSKHSWPVEFVIQINDGGQINGIYKNISQNVKMKISGQMYSNGSIEIYEQGGNLFVHLNKTRQGEYKGQATSGQTTLNVRLTEN